MPAEHMPTGTEPPYASAPLAAIANLSHISLTVRLSARRVAPRTLRGDGEPRTTRRARNDRTAHPSPGIDAAGERHPNTQPGHVPGEWRQEKRVASLSMRVEKETPTHRVIDDT